MPTRNIYEIKPVKLQPALGGEMWKAPTMAVKPAPSQSIAKGELLGMITSSQTYKAYATANVDGTGVAMAIAAYDCEVDASGNVFLGSGVPTDGPTVSAEQTLEVYVGGPFFVADLTGLDSGALVDLGARYLGNGDIVLIPS